AGPVAFVDLTAEWRRRHPAPVRSAAAERVAQHFAELVAQRADGRVCRLDATDLDRLCLPLTEPVVLSPDVLLAASSERALARGDFTLVVGEIHHGAQAAGWMASFAHDGWHDELAAFLPAPLGEIPANLVLRRRMKTAPPELPGLSVAASGVAARDGHVRLASLVVEVAGGRAVLRAPDGRALRFRPPFHGVSDDAYAPFAAFSYPLVEAVPVRLGMHTPRIEVGGVVYQRERWDVPTSCFPRPPAGNHGPDLLLGFRALRDRMGWSEQVFARVPGEPKPLHVDFASLLSVELLAHQIRQADGDVIVTEMLPGPGELWFGDGSHCSELRLVMVARAAE